MNKNRILSYLLTIAIVLGMVPAITVSASVTYAGGTGTKADPYLISTAEQLKYMRDTVNAGDGKSSQPT